MRLSILNQLRGVFSLGVLFLIISLFLFQSFNRKVFKGIVDAYHLDGGIIATGALRESAQKIDETLQRAGNVYRPKGINELYQKQFANLTSSLNSLKGDFSRFSSTHKLLGNVEKSLSEIDKVAQSILENEWSMGQFNAYLLTIKQYQIEVDESLSKTAIEFRLLLDKTYNEIQEEKNKPFIFSLVLTIFFAVILTFLSSLIFRRVRSFIREHIRATGEVSQGELDTRITSIGSDEFGQISREFNKMVAKLQVMTTELERSNQDLEDFAFTASHDLQTPLKHISSFSQLVVENRHSASDKELAEWAKSIQTSTNNVVRLIDDLLNFSKVGREGLALETIDTEALVEKIIEQTTKAFPKASIEKSHLPEIRGYSSLVHLIFQNLIENGIKYSGPEATARVKVTAICEEDGTQFRIADQGVGVPDDQKERVFGLFRRLHSQNEIDGSGAGLAICRKIVERHEGHIWIEDNQPQGSIFCFKIPKRVN